MGSIKKTSSSPLNKKALNELSKAVKILGFNQLSKDVKKAQTKSDLIKIKNLVIRDLKVRAGKRYNPISKKVTVIKEQDKKLTNLVSNFEKKFNLLLALI